MSNLDIYKRMINSGFLFLSDIEILHSRGVDFVCGNGKIDLVLPSGKLSR